MARSETVCSQTRLYRLHYGRREIRIREVVNGLPQFDTMHFFVWLQSTKSPIGDHHCCIVRSGSYIVTRSKQVRCGLACDLLCFMA